MKGTRAAYRYAKSFLRLAIEQKILDKVYGDVQLISSTIAISRDLENMLHSPIIKTGQKVNILEAIFKTSVDKVTMAFLELITKKKRERLLLHMCDRFIELYRTYKGILTAEVISASGLDEDMRKKVLELVRNSANSEVELVETTDEDLIGGFIIKVGDKQIDASVAHKLRELRKTFRENPYVKSN